MSECSIKKSWLIAAVLIFAMLIFNLIYVYHKLNNTQIVRTVFFAEDASTGVPLQVRICSIHNCHITPNGTVCYYDNVQDGNRPGRSITSLGIEGSIVIDAEGYEPKEIEIKLNGPEVYRVKLKKKEL